jgi:uncharacterized protein (TIGR02996 family)
VDAELSRLMQAVRKYPGDDLVRLAVADRLEELGGERNEVRAEFIRLQLHLAASDHATKDCAAAGCPACGRWRAWAGRENVLWNKAGEGGWVVDCPELRAWDACSDRNPRENLPGFYNVSYRLWHRGFISEVQCQVKEWEWHGPSLVRLHPVEKVRLLYVFTAVSGGGVWLAHRRRLGPVWGVLFPDGEADTARWSSEVDAETAVSAGALAWAHAEVKRQALR